MNSVMITFFSRLRICISATLSVIKFVNVSLCFRVTVILLCSLLRPSLVQAQLYPVQVTTQLIPPYSVYLSDYATPGNNKLRLVMLQRDLTKPSYQIRLQLSVELNGTVILRTSRSFNPAPIHLNPGVPTVISGIDLQPYVDSRNLDFIGISREEYERTKALPEGNYQICFTAYDYRRQDIDVSPPACSFFWLAKDEPPLINFPSCGTVLPVNNPQQIIFSWLPRNTSSPNSAAETEYEFFLYETRPAGRNPNDVVLTSKPIYHSKTDLTQLVYSQAEPLLFENMQYVWRVKANDKSGKDQFRNNGFSEVCTFTYGGAGSSNVQLEAVQDLVVEGKAERRGKASWTAQQVDGYKVFYKKKGSSNQWFSQQVQTDSVSIFDLDADTEYEVRVQAYIGAAYGPYSDIKKFKTLKPPIRQCGDVIPTATASGLPLPFALKGMIIDVQGIEMTITEVQASLGPGLFKGKGEVSIPYFGGAVFNVVFDNLFIDGTRTAIRGRIDFLTKGVEEWAKDKLEEQRKQELEEQQERNRELWKDTDFYDEVTYYKDFAIDSMYTNEAGEVIIKGDDGKTYINKEIPTIIANAPDKAVIIEDKNGDQWVVQKDGKVTKVPGGGLSPTYNIHVSKEALEIVKTALISLHNDYNESVLEGIQTELQTKQAQLDELIAIHNDQIMQDGNGTFPSDTTESASLFFDFVKVEDVSQTADNSDDPFIQLSIATKQKEVEHNRGLLLQVLGNQDNIKVVPDLIAREIRVGDETISDYISNAKAASKPDEEIITKTKESIVVLIDKLLVKVSVKMLDKNIE